MKGQRLAATLVVGTCLLTGTTGCSTTSTPAASAIQSSPAKAQVGRWIQGQIKVKNSSIAKWKRAAANSKASLQDRKIAEFIAEALAQNFHEISGQSNNKDALLSLLRSGKNQHTVFKVDNVDLPSLSSVAINQKTELDNGRMLYRMTGSVFTTVPGKLYPVPITVTLTRGGKVDQLRVANG
ncbi:hypothetical protein PP175_07020 [Aneurinibacillus sp. Ricciae_BoGa-3]|uniref:hypothetical protein n=1 Tax=Aneurinibacillus sp. Ricciae_BoGa-3 TaxID=3022697 RepID=UPI00233FC90A|nr:hypothetical protein [Aneurinibacillus sp. Ricciae_BoGa-3]WCK55686.1 hypothetical protein PP175_07020 [Aneurinibacillus sp. Ricciae_BoGa-3]